MCSRHGQLQFEQAVITADSPVRTIRMFYGTICSHTMTNELTCWSMEGDQLSTEPVPFFSVRGIAHWNLGSRVCYVRELEPRTVRCLGDAEITLSGNIRGVGDGCALLDGGTLVCWGRTVSCNNGPNCSGVACSQPVVVPFGRGSEVEGTTGRCMRLVGGGLACWGFGIWMGRSSGVDCGHYDAMTLTATSGIVGVRAARTFVCALGGSGDVFCWGATHHRMIGPRGWSVPRRITGGATALDVVTSDAGALVCVVTSAGRLVCLGDDVNEGLLNPERPGV